MITSISQLDVNKKYSYADYLTWQFGEMVELIKGKLFICSPAPASRHQMIAGNLHGHIWNFFVKKPCKVFIAPFDVRLVKERQEDKDIYTVVQPDICVICDEQKIDERGCVGAPDLIIEILSPYTAKKDLSDKYNLYQENGVREYWVVFPDTNAINQYILKDGRYEFEQPFFRNQVLPCAIFPGLKIDLQEIFS